MTPFTTTVHPMTGPAPVLKVLELTDDDLPIPMPNYGRRKADLPTRGAVLNALRCQVERLELIRQTLPSEPDTDQIEQLRVQALALLRMVMEDAEPGLGERLSRALEATPRTPAESARPAPAQRPSCATAGATRSPAAADPSAPSAPDAASCTGGEVTDPEEGQWLSIDLQDWAPDE